MAIHVDLSASALKQDAVVRFIRGHIAVPPPDDILFKITPATFAALRGRRPKTVAQLSPAEAEEINTFLQKPKDEMEYYLWKRTKCQCGRTLNFYDVFTSGRKRHGDAGIRAILSTSTHHYHALKNGQALEVECSACGTQAMVTSAYNTSQY
jgi:hypothetical protein